MAMLLRVVPGSKVTSPGTPASDGNGSGGALGSGGRLGVIPPLVCVIWKVPPAE